MNHFNSNDKNSFKEAFWQQFNCKNETQSLQTILVLFRSKLSQDGSLDILYDKAIELSCQYPVIKKTNYLSQMPSDVIEHFGKYLDKEESIEFGFVNRQLFIETLILNWSTLDNIIKYKPESALHYYQINLE